MDELETQIRGELIAVIAVIVELTGLPSHWSQRVELVPDADFRGKKLFRCDILIDRTLAGQPQRWSTLIHEALHTVSVGYVRGDYHLFRGWEEGVVEQLQRELRTGIFNRLGLGIDPAIFQEEDAKHAYNRFIFALERLRLSVAVPEKQQYYLNLLAIPIKERPASIFSSGAAFKGAKRVEFMTMFSASNSILTSNSILKG